MKIYLGADHAGFELKEKIKAYLTENKFEVEDCGAFTFDKNDDYPDFIGKVGEAVSKDPENSRGIIFGGSGQAEMVTANKFKGVRCALFYGPAVPIGAADVTGRISTNPYEIVRLTREHNDSNVLSIGARFVKDDEAIKVVTKWLNEPFPGDERHIRRINKIKDIENKWV